MSDYGQGNFPKGNPGRPPGSKNVRTKQWEALHESIIGEQSDKFNAFLNDLWSRGDFDEQVMAAELYLKVLEYFKPKQARQIIAGDNEAPLTITISEAI